MKFLLFGTGDYYERYKKWFPQDTVAALMDNSPVKQGTVMDGWQVLAPEEAVRLAYDAVLILSFYVREMKEQLLGLGVDEKKIRHFYELHDVFAGTGWEKRCIRYWEPDRGADAGGQAAKRQKILLLSHDLGLGGPSMALLHAAIRLKRYGYGVVFASMVDGPLKERLAREHIPVVVDENLQIETMEEALWTAGFDLVFCNTVNFYVFLSERDTGIPVIWWLHDSAFFYGGVVKEKLRALSRDNMRVASVGPAPGSAIKAYVPEMSVTDLLYGVEDAAGRMGAGHDDKIVFLTVGYIESRKGQDVLAHAVRMLPQEIRRQCKFLLVGQDTSMLAQQLKEEIVQIPQMRMLGTVGRDEIHRLMEGAQVLVVPSREDPMPTVAAEAMMHSTPCILSSAAGTSGYIQDGVNGWIFDSEDAKALAGKIEWCVLHRDRLMAAGNAARRLYEQVFSMDVFEKNLISLVEGTIGQAGKSDQ